MEVPDNLLCLFTAQLEEENGKYIIEVPAQEVTKGQINAGEMYRAVVLHTEAKPPDKQGQEDQLPNHSNLEPPVEMGERRTVDIEDIGEQGDGIARVERGYIVIVPDTEVNERVTIKIKNVSQNVAFGEVVERHNHYE